MLCIFPPLRGLVHKWTPWSEQLFSSLCSGCSNYLTLEKMELLIIMFLRYIMCPQMTYMLLYVSVAIKKISPPKKWMTHWWTLFRYHFKESICFSLIGNFVVFTASSRKKYYPGAKIQLQLELTFFHSSLSLHELGTSRPFLSLQLLFGMR